jgi:hypothetical protein
MYATDSPWEMKRNDIKLKLYFTHWIGEIHISDGMIVTRLEGKNRYYQKKRKIHDKTFYTGFKKILTTKSPGKNSFRASSECSYVIFS